MNFILDKILLFPYYLTLLIRNRMYDRGILKSYKSDIPTICVGNITVGGTGKTPMVELLVKIFKEDYRVAVVSRGYRRQTNNLREVSVLDSYLMVGDEPLQIKKKFPDVRVLVDANRRRAITYLEALPQDERPTLIILDDAFQHRSVTPHFSIVLVNSHRPIFDDSLLPFGRLRDLPQQIRRADMVIVTKMEREPDAAEREEWRQKLELAPNTSLLFSKTAYAEPLPVFPPDVDGRYLYAKSAVLFSGIANDRNLRFEVSAKRRLVKAFKYPDHYSFGEGDIKAITACAAVNPTAVVFTTEKDAQRLCGMQCVPVELKRRLYYLPIESVVIPSAVPQGCIEEEEAGFGEMELKRLITI